MRKCFHFILVYKGKNYCRGFSPHVSRRNATFESQAQIFEGFIYTTPVSWANRNQLQQNSCCCRPKSHTEISISGDCSRLAHLLHGLNAHQQGKHTKSSQQSKKQFGFIWVQFVHWAKNQHCGQEGYPEICLRKALLILTKAPPRD